MSIQDSPPPAKPLPPPPIPEAPPAAPAPASDAVLAATTVTMRDPRLWIAMALIAITFADMLLLFFVSLPDKNAAPLEILLGVAATGSTQMIQYFFGSSHGSQAKDATIAAAVGNAVKPT